MRRLAVGLLGVIAITSESRGGTFDPLEDDARSVGRAGVAVVSADGAAAIVANPAGLARRTSWRVQLGLGVSDRDARHTTDVTFSEGAVPTEDRAGATVAPSVAVQGGLGQRVTIGATLLSRTDAAADWGSITTPFVASSPDGHLDPHRYAGSAVRLTRRGGGIGVGIRALPWLAVGASAVLFDVQLGHERSIWAGPAAGQSIAELSPGWDQLLTVSARGWAPSATLGVIVAPEDVPVELGFSFTWSGDADLSGDATLSDTRTPGAATGTGGIAETTLRLPSTFRAGARFLTSRAVLEANVEHWRQASDPTWHLDGVAIVTEGASTALERVPLGPVFRDGFALRAAADVDLVRGFLALTAGYAYTGATTTRSRVSPIWPAGASHTISLGVEARVAGALVTLGAARTERAATTVPSAESGIPVIAPRAGDPTVPAAGGTWDASTTTVALTLELEWL